MFFVINKTTRKLKRCGFQNFLNNESFNSNIEECFEKQTILDPPLEFQEYWYNDITEEFQITAP